MIIRGMLADYAPTVGHETLTMIDEKTGRLFLDNDTMYLAFRSHRLIDMIPEGQKQRDPSNGTTLILQVDLTRLHELTDIYNGVSGFIKRETVEAYAEETRIGILKDPMDKLNAVLMILGNGLKTTDGNFWLVKDFNSEEFNNPSSDILQTENLARLSNGIITVVEEIEGVPDDLKTRWASVMNHRTLCAFGCGLYEAVAHVTGLQAETVRDVLFGLCTVIADTATDSIRAGASSLDFTVPPLGIVKVRADKFWDSPKVSMDTFYNIQGTISMLLKDPDVKKEKPVDDIVASFVSGPGTVQARIEAHAKELRAKAFESKSKQEVEMRALEQAKIESERQMLALRRRVLSALALDLEADIAVLKKVVLRQDRADIKAEYIYGLAEEARTSVALVQQAINDRFDELKAQEQEGTDWQAQRLKEKMEYMESLWQNPDSVQTLTEMMNNLKVEIHRLAKKRIVYSEGRKPRGGINVSVLAEALESGAAAKILVQQPQGKEVKKARRLNPRPKGKH